MICQQRVLDPRHVSYPDVEWERERDREIEKDNFNSLLVLGVLESCEDLSAACFGPQACFLSGRRTGGDCAELAPMTRPAAVLSEALWVKYSKRTLSILFQTSFDLLKYYPF